MSVLYARWHVQPGLPHRQQHRCLQRPGRRRVLQRARLAINGSSQYATNVASWINTWFLANDTYMNPNLNYAQVVRAPGSASRTRTHTSVLVLRGGNASAWTSEIDSGLVEWTKRYIEWLTTNEIALGEAAATKCVTLIHPPPLGVYVRIIY